LTLPIVTIYTLNHYQWKTRNWFPSLKTLNTYTTTSSFIINKNSVNSCKQLREKHSFFIGMEYCASKNYVTEPKYVKRQVQNKIKLYRVKNLRLLCKKLQQGPDICTHLILLSLRLILALYHAVQLGLHTPLNVRHFFFIVIQTIQLSF